MSRTMDSLCVTSTGLTADLAQARGNSSTACTELLKKLVADKTRLALEFFLDSQQLIVFAYAIGSAG